jgi:Zn finger protein HypA/HybF involved in hydrogenase expression
LWEGIVLKVKCPDCKHRFDIDENEYDEGDYLSCPECNLELTVEVSSGGRLNIKTAKEKEMDNSEFDDYFEE